MRDAPAAPWRAPLAEVLGWRAGQPVMLVSSLAAPAVVTGTLVSGPAGLEVQVDARFGPALAAERFAWAWRRSVASTAIVELWGGHAVLRGDVASAIEGQVVEVRDRGSGAYPAPQHGCAGLEVSTRGVIVRDRWGDAVASTALDDAATWLGWIDRLAAIDDWLAAGRASQAWPDHAFTVRCGGLGPAGARTPWPHDSAVAHAGTAVWVELEALTPCLPAYVGVFRITALREVESLTQHLPGGLPLSARYPVTALDHAQTLRLTWPGCAGDERTEQLVVMVSDGPLPFTTMARSGVPTDPGRDPDRVDHRRRPRLWTRTITYRLTRESSGYPREP